jgi:hypothetical protein
MLTGTVPSFSSRSSSFIFSPYPFLSSFFFFLSLSPHGLALLTVRGLHNLGTIPSNHSSSSATRCKRASPSSYIISCFSNKQAGVLFQLNQQNIRKEGQQSGKTFLDSFEMH